LLYAELYEFVSASFRNTGGHMYNYNIS